MKIAIATEMNMYGKVPEGFTNMRVEFCWAKALDATFIPINFYDPLIQIQSMNFDYILYILPKKTREYDSLPIKLKQHYPNIKIGIIQEGPITLYQDWKVNEQMQWFQSLSQVDIVFVHNEADKQYITNLVPIKKCEVIPSLIDTSIISHIKPLPEEQRKGVIISGNFSSWYGGMHGLLAIMKYNSLFDGRIAIPGSGRITDDERKFCKENNIEILPWVDWKTWMETLNTFKYGINLMPTRAAGTFSRDCLTLLIPCLSFEDLDTQRIMMPDLCVKKDMSNLSEVILKMVSGKMYMKDYHYFEIDNHKERLRKILEKIK